MNFRYVRKSNDAYAWIGLSLSLLGLTAFIIAFFHREPAFPKAFIIALLALFIASFVWFLKNILKPFERELVVEAHQIRWGRSDHLAKQQYLRIEQLIRVVHDKTDCQVLGEVGNSQLVPIGAGILIQATEQAALIEFLRQAFPNLKIEAA